MTILLQWLVEHAWVFYAACAVGIIIYFLRAMAARRERNLALFTLERETATSRLVQSWAMVLVFVAIGAAIFFSTAFILPELPIYSAGTPPPTPPEPTEVPTPVPTDTPEVAISGEVRARFGDFAELIGYDLPAGEVTAAQPLLLTLYWRGLDGTSPTNYLVFTHLLSQDGRLIAQHDGPPAGGTRPTSSWAAGEIIADPHPMAFADTAYVGLATIAVGLYDPAVGRIPIDTGADRVVLPVTVSVIPQ